MWLDNSSVRVHAYSRVQFHFLAVRKLWRLECQFYCACWCCVYAQKRWKFPRIGCSHSVLYALKYRGTSVSVPSYWRLRLRKQCRLVHQISIGVFSSTHVKHTISMHAFRFFTYYFFHIIGDTFPHSCNHCMVTTWTVPTYPLPCLSKVCSGHTVFNIGWCWLDRWALPRLLPTVSPWCKCECTSHQPGLQMLKWSYCICMVITLLFSGDSSNRTCSALFHSSYGTKLDLLKH